MARGRRRWREITFRMRIYLNYCFSRSTSVQAYKQHYFSDVKEKKNHRKTYFRIEALHKSIIFYLIFFTNFRGRSPEHTTYYRLVLKTNTMAAVLQIRVARLFINILYSAYIKIVYKAHS